MILLGREHSDHLSPFVTSSQCRSLLPIRNRPCLWYCLQSVLSQMPKSGWICCPSTCVESADQFPSLNTCHPFAEILVVCQSCHRESVQHSIESFKDEFPFYSAVQVVAPEPLSDQGKHDGQGDASSDCSGALAALRTARSFIKV